MYCPLGLFSNLTKGILLPAIWKEISSCSGNLFPCTLRASEHIKNLRTPQLSQVQFHANPNRESFRRLSEVRNRFKRSYDHRRLSRRSRASDSASLREM